jgi:hypothetical protein
MADDEVEARQQQLDDEYVLARQQLMELVPGWPADVPEPLDEPQRAALLRYEQAERVRGARQ